jgi:hypothetical protein
MRVNFDDNDLDDEDGDWIPCKRCRRPMVELARYDVMNEIPGAEGPGLKEYVFGGADWIVLRWVGIIFVGAWWWVKLKIKDWRLQRVLCRYPHTLICANCGTLWKR